MSAWSLLIVEGPEDVWAVRGLAAAFGGWTLLPERPPAVPAAIDPSPPSGTLVACHVEKGGRFLAVRSLGGVDRVLGKIGSEFAALFSRTRAPIAVMVDADTVGVEARARSVREAYAGVLPSAEQTRAGEVVRRSEADAPFGLWVAPDNAARGSFLTVVRDAVSAVWPQRLEAAEDYILRADAIWAHDWGPYREKAVLGAYAQPIKAGLSLASALQDYGQWFRADAPPPAVERFLGFLDALVA